MTEPYRERIDHPGAWTARTVGGKEDFVLTMRPEQVAAVDDLLASTAHLASQEVTRADFDHPDLTPFLAGVREEIMHGRGLIIVRGIDRDRYTVEQCERIFWGFGTHLGVAAVQSPKGERMGHVRFVPVGPDNPVNRAYRGKHELTMHTDTQETVGLMSVQKAKAGGYSCFSSALAVHNEIRARHPEYLDQLYEGYYFATNEASLTDQPITPYKVPVFCNIDGTVSCVWKVPFIYRAGKMNGGLPKEMADALACFEQLAKSDELRVQFMLEQGEMALWNNYTVLHARTSYDDFDEPERKRLLLRLWLDVPGGRPVIPVYHRDLVTGN